MDQLSKYFTLDHYIAVYIPSTVDVDQKTDAREYIDGAVKLLSDNFGGATCYEAQGAWTTKAGSVVTEDVTIVKSYATKDQLQDGGIEAVISYAHKIKTELGQESVLIEYDNKAYLI